jgi:AraC-like DNA-binding protein
MKPVHTEIGHFIKSPLYVELKDEPYLTSAYYPRSASYHAHPELQLTFILEGFGKRIIGNKISQFEPGDMVFIGSNVPHIWISDPVFYEEDSLRRSKAITVYINQKIFQQMFDSVKEMNGIRDMIEQASKGINIFGETRNEIADKLINLCSEEGFEKVRGLMEIMHLISISSEKCLIINKDYEAVGATQSDRLVNVIKFIKDNLHEQITLSQVADVACMTIQSFCRFFKSRMKKTFSEYLNALRVSHACKLLIELDRPISDVANLSGFISHSHFCRVFKEQIGKSPYQYRAEINKRKEV